MAAQRGIGLILMVVVGRGPTVGLTPPATVDLRFLAMTFGLSLKVNLVGVVGVVLAAVALRRL